MDRDEPGYAQLIGLLDSDYISYRLISHRPEGRTDAASALRGHPLDQAAKSVMVRVASGKRSRRYVLAVVPGDRRVDLRALADRYSAREAAFASRHVAERLAGSVSGSFAPFAFSPDLDLLVDDRLLAHREIYFNACRLDLSIALPVAHYLALARPQIAPIATAT
ncbi:YbaK/EbsC family protein [Actinoplanes sp. NPDC049548]|uniref:YbaK/EbsC family protein n=1 Tax=Actinoplanes sp. NPDC049548 TaxID=3155152 RepID=UPI00342F7063